MIRGGPMPLRPYFTDDDGSLPEIELHYADAERLVASFVYLYSLPGMRDMTRSDRLWDLRQERETGFVGPEDSRRVVSGEVSAFHRLLEGLRVGDRPLPALGVFVDPDRLVLDYRMGAEWGDAEIFALMRLLAELRRRGARIAVPGWGADGDCAFRMAVDEAATAV